LAVGEKAKVANTNKTTRQHVEEESAQELLDRHGDQAVFVFVSRISPAKRDLARVQSHQPVVGQRDAVSVSTEITKNMFRAAEGPFAIHHPIVAEELPEPGRKGLGLSQKLQGSMKTELALGESMPESLGELASKNST
jgi:hypothetical protein